MPFRQYWDLLSDHICSQKLRFWLLTVLLLGSIGLQIWNPQVMRRFIDEAQAGGSLRQLLGLAFAFLLIALVQQAVSVAATYVGENVAWIATNALRSELARHCLYLDMSFYSEHSPGELIERIDGDVAQLSNFFSQLVIRVLGNVFLLFGVLAALFVENVRIGLGLAALSALTLFVLFRIRGIAVPYDKARRQAEADLFGYLEERLSGTEDIRSSGAVDYVLRGLFVLQYAIQGLWLQAGLLGRTIGLVGGMMRAAGLVLALGAGYVLFRQGAVTVGAVYLVVHYTDLIGRPIRELTQQVENLQTIGASTERLAELKAIQSKTADGHGVEIPLGPLDLSFDHVSFAYDQGESVLKDVSFALEPGKTIGLLGRTGSGKTTLARLVMRLYDPDKGRIALGGVDLCEPALQTLRQRVALVTQDVQLFKATVRDNLTFFNRSISDARIHQVIAELELDAWYRGLPNGLDTPIEAGGRGLSAGEAQLLAFTRVFLRDPGLVILDEASSRLDPATEQQIERAVDHLLHNRTAIVIAHRLGTVHRADEIMILGQGRVVEYGDRRQLAADSTSLFYSLLQTGLEEVLA